MLYTCFTSTLQNKTTAIGPTARRIQDIFFKVTGLEGFTRFMRIYAAGMAEAFAIRAAEGAKEGDTILARQLESLGLTPQEVEAYGKKMGVISLGTQR